MEHARQIGVEQLLPRFVGHIVERPGADDAGVGYQNVETAQGTDGFLDCCCHRRRVPDVHHDRKANAAKLFDVLGRTTEIVLGGQRITEVHRSGRIGDRDGRPPLTGQRQDMRAPPLSARSPPGDERDATIQRTHGQRA